MSARVHGETTAANVVQQTPIKMRGTEQGDNVPAKQMVARIQAVTDQIRQKQADVQKESDKLQKMLDGEDFGHVDQKVLTRQVKSLSDQVAELGAQVQESHAQLQAAGLLPQDPDDGSGTPVQGTGTGMMACYGYQAQAEQALNDLTTQLMKLQNLVRELNVAVLEQQRGKDVDGKIEGGTLVTTANAIVSSADQDADLSIQERNKSLAGVASSVVGLGATAGIHIKTKIDLKTPTSELGQMRAFKDSFEQADPAQAVHTDGRPKEITSAQRKRMQELSEGSGKYAPKDGDEAVLAHLKAGEDIPGVDGVRKGLRASTREHLATAMHGRELEINTAWTQAQTRIQTANTATQMGSQAADAAFNARQADDKREKGYADARKMLVDYTSQQFNALEANAAEAAKQYDQEAAEINRSKQTVNNQSTNG